MRWKTLPRILKNAFGKHFKEKITVMTSIQRIKLQNFRRFQSFDAKLDNSLNIFIGDNESGKSTLLLALDIVLSGSRAKVESIGLENLFNATTIMSFLSSDKRIENLPTLFIELYLNEQNDHDLNGKNNSIGVVCDGIQLICQPIDQLGKEIKSILEQKEPCFPFEYYETQFYTFSAKPYTGYNRPIRHLFIDSTAISNEYATREYVKELYNNNIEGTEKNKHQNEYRKHKEQFKNEVLAELNDRLDKYSFTIRNTGKTNLEADLTISDCGIAIENKGKGQQCFIKTEFALNKPKRQENIKTLLLEEPENHLSHVNMKKLIRKIRESAGRQLFIATHSNLISARLDLRRCILLNSNSTNFASLDSIPNDTAEFFMKAPDSHVLELILSKKVILVEGDAEFILTEAFFTKIASQSPEEANIHIISVGGTSFKRYLEIAKILNIRTAVIRDNDGNYQDNCIDRYSEYACDHIRVFADIDNERHTFEVCVYADNNAVCESLFVDSRRTNDVKEYMLKNKTEAAFLLLKNKKDELTVPKYIQDAIEWIKQ
jgi:predicted ATP-dependent endonuclease of OLD family